MNLSHLRTLLAAAPANPGAFEEACARAHEEFADLPEAPELSPEAFEATLKALGRLEGAAMAIGWAEDDEARARALELAASCLATLAELEAAYSRAIYDGPACHPFLNRVLLHIEYFQRDPQASDEATQMLLAELPDLVRDLSRLWAGLPAVEVMHDLAAELVGAVEDFRSWLASGRDSAELERIGEQLLADATRLTFELSSRLERRYAEPTPWAPVNIVAAVPPEGVAEAAARAMRFLELRFPHPGPLAKGVEHVRSELSRLPGPLEPLLSATRELLAAAASLEAEDAELDVVHGEGLVRTGNRAEGLPPMLADLYRMAEAFLARSCEALVLERGITALDALIERSRASGRSSDEQAEAELEAVTSALRALLVSRTTTHLEQAFEAMERARDRLAEIQS